MADEIEGSRGSKICRTKYRIWTACYVTVEHCLAVFLSILWLPSWRIKIYINQPFLFKCLLNVLHTADHRLYIMMEQLKMTVETFGQQLQQLMVMLQWLAGRLGSAEEIANQLPHNIQNSTASE